MSITYDRINWQNEPSTATKLNATNLNKMDKGIDDVVTVVNDLVEVEANPVGAATEALVKLGVGESVYSIPQIVTFTAADFSFNETYKKFIKSYSAPTGRTVAGICAFTTDSNAVLGVRYSSNNIEVISGTVQLTATYNFQVCVILV